MTIEMRKFGMVLNARPADREALLAIRPSLSAMQEGQENLIVDFRGINVLTPSIADEFVTPLAQQYGNRLRLTHTQENVTVRKTLAFLARD